MTIYVCVLSFNLTTPAITSHHLTLYYTLFIRAIRNTGQFSGFKMQNYVRNGKHSYP